MYMDVEKISGVFERSLGEEVLFAYLHGSYATGDETDLSDLDIAVFTEGDFGLKERAKLSRELSRELGVEADISVLNNASIGFKHQVLKKGELIYSRDRERRTRFEEEVYRKYLDIKPFMERFNEIRRSA
jgi:predicted nucleotidyltransferase